MATVVEALAAAPKPQTEPGFFSREAGQARREWLAKELGYFIPPELRPVMGLANEINPVASMERAGTSAQTVFDPNAGGWDRVGAGANMLTEMAGVAAPMAMSGKGAVKAADAITESLTGLAVLPKAVGADFLADEFGGIKLYHGSPHDFDKFSMDKIGTGEGAQAYGHGLYFAENEGVARGYRDTLSAGARTGTGRGAVDVYSSNGSEIPAQLKPAADIAEMMQRHAIDPSSPDGSEWLSSEIAARGMQDADAQEVLRLFGAPIEKSTTSGRMYEVDINANPEDFLDWDAPLSAQPQKVRDAFPDVYKVKGWQGDMVPLRDVMDQYSASGLDPAKAAEPYLKGVPSAVDDLAKQYGSHPAATAALREAGIPGIRYKDAGSRGADGTSGTSNYVVFDDKLINVLGKDGVRSTPEGKAQTVLDMLQSGRGGEVTEDMLDLGDPTQNARLNDFLGRNYDLPMDEASRMQRAREMGFDTETPLYHGANADINAFDASRQGQREASFHGQGIYSSAAPDYASEYARGDGGNVMPMTARRPNEFQWPDAARNFQTAEGAQKFTNQAEAAGYSGVRVPLGSDTLSDIEANNFEVVTFAPRNIRSRFARFDPRLKHLANLSAGGAGLGVVNALSADSEAELRSYLAERGL